MQHNRPAFNRKGNLKKIQRKQKGMAQPLDHLEQKADPREGEFLRQKFQIPTESNVPTEPKAKEQWRKEKLEKYEDEREQKIIEKLSKMKFMPKNENLRSVLQSVNQVQQIQSLSEFLAQHHTTEEDPFAKTCLVVTLDPKRFPPMAEKQFNTILEECGRQKHKKKKYLRFYAHFKQVMQEEIMKMKPENEKQFLKLLQFQKNEMAAHISQKCKECCSYRRFLETLLRFLGPGWVQKGKTEECPEESSMTNQALLHPCFKRLFQRLALETTIDLMVNKLMLMPLGHNYVQIAGRCIDNIYFNNISIGEEEQVGLIGRGKIFYCDHFNGKDELFRRNPFTLIEKFSFQQVFDRYINLNGTLLMSVEQPYQHLLVDFVKDSMLNYHKKVKLHRLVQMVCGLGKDYKEIKNRVMALIKGNPDEEEAKLLFKELYARDTPHLQVFSLLKNVLYKTVPDFFGRNNLKILLKQLKRFISYKRFEQMTVQSITKNMDVNELKINEMPYKKHSSIMKLLDCMTDYLFEHLLIPILRSIFYATEQHGRANEVFFYRKPLWMLISKLSIFQFAKKNLEPAPEENKPGFMAKLRILPKADTFRPIMTFFNESKAQEKYMKRRAMSINQKFREIAIVLRRFKQELPEQLGFSVFDNHQISQKMADFKAKWVQKGSPKLYYSTLDISKCFDSIDTTKLLAMVQGSPLFEQMYLLTEYVILQRSHRFAQNLPLHRAYRIRRRQTAVSAQELSRGSLENLFCEGDTQEALLMGYNRFVRLDKSCILERVAQVCDRQMSITYQRQHYIQTKGIPQGLCISPVLCSLYFGHIENIHVVNGLLKQPRLRDSLVLVMRMTDDYLILSDDGYAVQQVIKCLQYCSYSYGFQFNHAKQQTNLNNTHHHSFAWLGKEVNVDSFYIAPNLVDRRRLYYQINVNFMDNVNTTSQLQRFLCSKLKSSLTNHFLSYVDIGVNSSENCITIFKGYCQQSAYKFLAFLERLPQMGLSRGIPLVQVVVSSIQMALHDMVLLMCRQLNTPQPTLYLRLYRLGLEQFSQAIKSRAWLSNQVSKALLRNALIRRE